ncbi:murein hydrolase activator EnvC family protein [Flavisolibacter nicotianae]|uniref:murein hydrolase activator EnvC family protein n=1 Tax=Flavisolibacter nicotianae TaxID=2364882 RepID=UPI0013C44195|nr:peptidoglycan DD-metalloendopeptidase family protein [Flavisolibacter nicotianae]
MKKLFFLLTCVLAVQVCLAQSEKEKMQRERQQLQQELREIQANYSKVKGQQKATIGQLNILQNKMQVQNRYISNINSEIKLLNDDIYVSNVELTRLQRQLDTLKEEYARSVVYAYKNNSTYDYLNFIFSAGSFNDALRRVAYLKSYQAYNESKVKTIKETQSLIEQRKQQLLGKTNQKHSALLNQKEQLNELEGQKKEKDEVVQKLKSQANDLAKQISIKKKRDQQLRNQIAAAIRREIEKAREEERKRIAALKAAEANKPKTSTTTTETSTAAVTPKAKTTTARREPIPLNEGELKLANSFERNHGGLPWPVDNGYVSIPFGVSNIGGLMMDNPGLTISTQSAGVPVKAVFDGEVSAVSNTGEGMMVMIRHGRYFTVYSNLSSASVNRGDAVRTGQAIGRAATADDGTGGQVDFMLMVGEKNVNPRPWLR